MFDDTVFDHRSGANGGANHLAGCTRYRPPQVMLDIATAPNPKRWSFVDKTRAANRLIESSIAAMQSPLVEFLEIEDKLLNAAGETQPELYLKDQLHLNEAGYKILSAAVLPRLK